MSEIARTRVAKPRSAARGSASRRAVRLVAWLLVLAGAALVVATAAGITFAGVRQYNLNQQWAHDMAMAPPPAKSVEPPAANLLHPVNGVDFAIRVPSIDYFSAVEEGVTSDILYIGPGHYPETRWPGQTGTVAVAAHNTYWLKFGDLKPGDIVLLETRYGVFKYRITGSRIVQPDDRTILTQNLHQRRLVLTTCWPLWAGALADRRLIYFADEIYPNEPVVAPQAR